jgi:endonuclease III
VTARGPAVNRSKRREIFERLRAANPHPTTELEYGNPFQLLVAVVLSAQSTDAGVNRATRRLFRKIRTPADMLALGEEGLREHIKTIGLFNSKAGNLIKTCAILEERYDGKVPENREALEALPGVGRKTASVILNTAFGQPTIAVDTHIFRVANRTGIAPGENVMAVENRLQRVVPEEFRKDAHHWLILLGRYTCVARKPRCMSCPIPDLCEYPQKNLDQEPAGRR